jgi:DNA-binding NtrC family response regulator
MSGSMNGSSRTIVGYGTIDLLDKDGHARPLKEIKDEVLKFAIVHYQGQMSEVARRLNIGRSTIYRRIEIMDITAFIP